MEFNYALEKKKFDHKWNHLRPEYRNAGMSTKAIQELYEYDWAAFKLNRVYAKHTQPMPIAFAEEDGHDFDGKSPLFEKFFSAMSINDDPTTTSRYAWVDEIEGPNLYRAVKSLKAKDLELLTLFAIDGLDQIEIAMVLNCTQANISKKIKRIKIILGKRL